MNRQMYYGVQVGVIHAALNTVAVGTMAGKCCIVYAAGLNQEG